MQDQKVKTLISWMVIIVKTAQNMQKLESKKTKTNIPKNKIGTRSVNASSAFTK